MPSKWLRVGGYELFETLVVGGGGCGPRRAGDIARMMDATKETRYAAVACTVHDVHFCGSPTYQVMPYKTNTRACV